MIRLSLQEHSNLDGYGQGQAGNDLHDCTKSSSLVTGNATGWGYQVVMMIQYRGCSALTQRFLGVSILIPVNCMYASSGNALHTQHDSVSLCVVKAECGKANLTTCKSRTTACLHQDQFAILAMLSRAKTSYQILTHWQGANVDSWESERMALRSYIALGLLNCTGCPPSDASNKALQKTNC